MGQSNVTNPQEKLTQKEPFPAGPPSLYAILRSSLGFLCLSRHAVSPVPPGSQPSLSGSWQPWVLMALLTDSSPRIGIPCSFAQHWSNSWFPPKIPLVGMRKNECRRCVARIEAFNCSIFWSILDWFVASVVEMFCQSPWISSASFRASMAARDSREQFPRVPWSSWSLRALLVSGSSSPPFRPSPSHIYLSSTSAPFFPRNVTAMLCGTVLIKQKYSIPSKS